MKLLGSMCCLAVISSCVPDPSSEPQPDANGIAPSTEFASCAALAPTCGSTGAESCCAAGTKIPGGTFARGYDGAGDGVYADQSYTATVHAFMLDKYEVTVGRFRAFVNAGKGTQAAAPNDGDGAHATIAASGWQAIWNPSLVADTTTLVGGIKCDPMYQTWTDATGANENLPINCVTWYEAMAFCIWDGGYLPTDAEWNYAASGGVEQRAYPWSTPATALAIDCSHADYLATPPTTYCQNGATGAASPVGSDSPAGDGKWGHADLAGNVYEWALDWYAPTLSATTCDDCANLTPTTGRVLRGGGFVNDATVMRSAYRNTFDPTDRYFDIGMRCAHAPL